MPERKFIVSGSLMEYIKSIHVLAKDEGEAMAKWVAKFGEDQVLTFQPMVYEVLPPSQDPSGHDHWKGDGHAADVGGDRYPTEDYDDNTLILLARVERERS